MQRKGYHYTSLANWERIKEEGLAPYDVPPHVIAAFPFPPPQGVWLWDKNPIGKSHFGNVVFQMGRKNVDDVVKLEVRYDSEELVHAPDKREVAIIHDGKIGEYQYHEGEKAVLHEGWISPKNITLVGQYNIARTFLSTTGLS